MELLLSRLSIQPEIKPITYYVYDLNGRLCHANEYATTLNKPRRSVRFHMGGVPYDIQVADGKDEERFMQRFYDAIDRKKHRRSVVTYGDLHRRLCSCAGYEEEFVHLLSQTAHSVRSNVLLCVSEAGFFSTALRLYLYLGSCLRAIESFLDGEEHLRFRFRVRLPDSAGEPISDCERLSFSEIARLLGRKSGFLYAYLVYSAIATGADAFAEIQNGEMSFMLSIPLYDPTCFSFYGVVAPTAAEIREMHVASRQLFAGMSDMLCSSEKCIVLP